MDTSISGADSWFTLNGKPLSFREESENLDAGAFECNSDIKRGNILKVIFTAAPSPDTIDVFADGEQLPTAYSGVWEWRPPLGFAGLCELQVKVQEYSIQVARIRVLPEKLSQDRYEIMLSDLSTIATDLLIRLNSWATEKAVLQLREQDISPLRDYQLMKEIISQLEDVMFHIRRSPYHVLSTHNEQRLLHEVHLFSSETVPLSGNVLALPKTFKSLHGINSLPETWMVPQSTPTYDVHENRLLKQFVQHQLIAKLHFIQERAKSELRRLEKDYEIAAVMSWKKTREQLAKEIRKLELVVAECEQMMYQCVAWGSESFLRSVRFSGVSGKATQFLLKSPFYSRFFQLYLRFQQELTISLDTQNYLTDLAMQKVCDLYEVWSVFEITKMAMDELTKVGYRIASSSLFYEVERNHFQFKVRKNVPSIVLIKDDIRVEIKYEPIYVSKANPSVASIPALVANLNDPLQQRTPDLAIEVYEHDQPKTVIIFDVKYKWQGNDGSRGPNSDDKNKMREYKDIICYKPYNLDTHPRLRKIVSNAYILFPGDLPWQEPSNKVGALPLIPDMDSRRQAAAEKTVKYLLRSARLL
jgi:PD-(D/E)XK nuclease superfamily/Domain of unknown function (DUF2357)